MMCEMVRYSPNPHYYTEKKRFVKAITKYSHSNCPLDKKSGLPTFYKTINFEVRATYS